MRMINDIRNIVINQENELEKAIKEYVVKKVNYKNNKLIYITSLDIEQSWTVGVYKKVLGQVEAFKLKFDKVKLVNYEGNKQIIRCEGQILNELNLRTDNHIEHSLEKYENIYNYIVNNNIEYVYIRYEMSSDLPFIIFLSKVRDKVKKIFIEIPTYPYDPEVENAGNQNAISHLNTDRYFRRFLFKYVDKVVTFTNDEEIFGISTIKINNGIDTKNIKVKKIRAFNGEINLIGVAAISYWHGFDRIIEGMKEYYNHDGEKYIVKFHVVGQGAELSNLINLVNKYGLNKYVIFYGTKVNEELDDIFDICDIGIGGLGIHRKNLKNSSALKTREYCAKGMPFLFSGEEKDISSDVEFVLNIKENDQPVDIAEVVEFYKRLQKNKNITQEIRKYAEENFDWNVTINEVIDGLLYRRE